jgi:hypothetical protein
LTGELHGDTILSVDKVRPWLVIGRLAETLDTNALAHNGIGAMLQLAEAVPQKGIASLYVPVLDGETLTPEKLQRGVAFIREQKAQGNNVLVACGLGVSRAATFATAALKEEEGLTLREAFAEVAAARVEARPHPELWQSLCDIYGESVSYPEMLKICRPLRIKWT